MKKALSFLLALVILLSLAACGGNGSGGNSSGSGSVSSTDAPSGEEADYPGGVVTIGEIKIGFPDSTWRGEDNGFRGISLYKDGHHYRSDPTIKVFLNDTGLERSMRDSESAYSSDPDSDFEVSIGGYDFKGNTFTQHYMDKTKTAVIERLYYRINDSLTLYFQLFNIDYDIEGIDHSDPDAQSIMLSVIELNGLTEEAFGKDDDGDGYIDSGTDLRGAEWSLSTDGVLTIKCTDGIEGHMNSTDYPWYKYADSITSLRITGNITEIPNLAFTRLVNLKEASLPDTIESMCISCFKECSSLEKVNIPASLKTAEYNIFYACESLTEVTVPGSLTHINNYDFAFCTSLKKAVISPGVQSMGYDAFDGCTALTELYLPRSLTLIDLAGFRDVPDMDVYYEGTEAEFAAITMEQGNETFRNATVHYNTSFEQYTAGSVS